MAWYYVVWHGVAWYGMHGARSTMRCGIVYHTTPHANTEVVYGLLDLTAVHLPSIPLRWVPFEHPPSHVVDDRAARILQHRIRPRREKWRAGHSTHRLMCHTWALGVPLRLYLVRLCEVSSAHVRTR